MSDSLIELVRYIASSLVDAPDEVEVTLSTSADNGRRTIGLSVAPDDRGKVIGKKGRVAHNMRILLTAASKEEDPVHLEIIDA